MRILFTEKIFKQKLHKTDTIALILIGNIILVPEINDSLCCRGIPTRIMHRVFARSCDGLRPTNYNEVPYAYRYHDYCRRDCRLHDDNSSSSINRSLLFHKLSQGMLISNTFA